MRPSRSANLPLLHAQYSWPIFSIDLGLILLLFFLPNMMIGWDLIYHSTTPELAYQPKNNFSQFYHHLRTVPQQSIMVLICANLLLTSLLFVLRRHVLTPIYGMAFHVHSMLTALQPAAECTEVGGVATRMSLKTIARDMAHMTYVAHSYYLKHHEAKQALANAEEALNHIHQHHEALVSCTSREITAQYTAVLAYARYLEERIHSRTLSPDLLNDFDEVNESGFTLKLIAGALELLQRPGASVDIPIDIAQLLQETMLTLCNSLDRRSMKLSSSEVEENIVAVSDARVVSHVLWMMLLGIIRYAADESTLRLGCQHTHDQSHALIRIVVNELSPGTLSEAERSSFLVRQCDTLTPHLFAQSIREHANLQLAEMLMTPLGGALTVTPLTTYSCEITLALPSRT